MKKITSFNPKTNIARTIVPKATASRILKENLPKFPGHNVRVNSLISMTRAKSGAVLGYAIYGLRWNLEKFLESC